jgi:hypothetical protein
LMQQKSQDFSLIRVVLLDDNGGEALDFHWL